MSGLDPDDDIPMIGQAMLHRESVDFEQRMRPWPPWSLALIGLCVVAFALQLAGGGLEDLDRLLKMGALERTRVVQGDYWRTLSAAFLHGGPDHLIGNLVVLYILGMACEHAYGGPQFLILYVLSALAGSLLSLTGGQPSVGASGAIFGLVGALIVLFIRHRRELHVRDRRIGLVLAVWAAYQIALGFLNPAVDNRAHVGGLIGGALVALILRPAVIEGRREVAAQASVRVGFACALLALLITAWYFVPRLIP